jgi:hypothetical protein
MRFEIGLATSLRFTGTPLAGELGREETTAIDFRGHCFVWHEIDEEHDPTLSIVLTGESPGGSAQRLLSALAWESNTAIASVVFGFHPSVEPFDPPRAKAPRSSHELTLRPRPRTVAVAPDPMLELALAHYRESLNAGSIFYRFLALWNTLDVVLGPGLDEFLRERAAEAWQAMEPDLDLADDVAGYFRDSSRNAVAHPIRDRPGRTAIDPDDPAHQGRLLRNGWLLAPLARTAIETLWPRGVTTTH